VVRKEKNTNEKEPFKKIVLGKAVIQVSVRGIRQNCSAPLIFNHIWQPASIVLKTLWCLEMQRAKHSPPPFWKISGH